jgi:L-amino acid N-acyltransferase YncA
VHDIVDLESRGVPAVFAASREFVIAAAAQSEALGFPAARVFVDHPIQDRSDEEMRALADSAMPELIAAITSKQL